MLFTVDNNTNLHNAVLLKNTVELLISEFSKGFTGMNFEDYFHFVVKVGTKFKEQFGGGDKVQDKEMIGLWLKGIELYDDSDTTCSMSLVQASYKTKAEIVKPSNDVVEHETSIVWYGDYVKGRKIAMIPFIHHDYRWRIEIKFKDPVTGRKYYILNLLKNLQIQLTVAIGDTENFKLKESQINQINIVTKAIIRIIT